MMKKINLGCGPVGKDDWINIDWGILAILHKLPFLLSLLYGLRLVPGEYKVNWPKNLRLHDCRKKLPFADDSVDYIYTSHFLEHLKAFEAEGLLKDCHRILKEGGVLRVIVPDLKKILAKYVEGDRGFFQRNFNAQEARGEVPLADLLTGIFYPQFYRRRFYGADRIRSLFIRPHLWMYDRDSLAGLLSSCGFKSIAEKDFRKGDVPDLDVLDVFGEISLYIEAKK